MLWMPTWLSVFEAAGLGFEVYCLALRAQIGFCFADLGLRCKKLRSSFESITTCHTWFGVQASGSRVSACNFGVGFSSAWQRGLGFKVYGL